jgi:putative oxygen-independent coproporphyrinogen III oxidase
VKKVSLYLHIPFCSTRCGYCHFNTYEGLERLFDPYTDALCTEITTTAARLRDEWTAHTIFVGGGTPTYLPPDNFIRILQTLREQWRWTPDIEITTEANPTHITQAYLERLREAGVNRVSFGAQAFEDDLLRMLDREHSAAQIGEAVHAARRAGFTNVSLDLMYGLPLQTLAQWQHSLDEALKLEPDHLSLYGLTIDEGTAFKKRVQTGALPVPDEELAADMYEFAEQCLAESGMRQYEISNWARLNRECHFIEADDISHDLLLWSRHNRTYWLNEPYLGFGPGAHSFFGGRRSWDLNAPQVYIERLKRGQSVEGGAELISPELERAETVMLGLRLNEGVSRRQFAARFQQSLDDCFGVTLQQCAEWGLIVDDGERVRLTPRGRLLSNEVFQRLLPD